jgi:hypothetical protein
MHLAPCKAHWICCIHLINELLDLVLGQFHVIGVTFIRDFKRADQRLIAPRRDEKVPRPSPEIATPILTSGPTWQAECHVLHEGTGHEHSGLQELVPLLLDWSAHELQDMIGPGATAVHDHPGLDDERLPGEEIFDLHSGNDVALIEKASYLRVVREVGSCSRSR